MNTLMIALALVTPLSLQAAGKDRSYAMHFEKRASTAAPLKPFHLKDLRLKWDFQKPLKSAEERQRESKPDSRGKSDLKLLSLGISF